MTSEESQRLSKLVYKNAEFARNQPVAILTAGVSGAGKSATLASCLRALQMRVQNFIVHDPDYLIENMEHFTKNTATNPDIADECFQAAGVLNDYLTENSLSQRFNVILDGTGKNYNKKKAEIAKLKSLGYKVILIATHVKLDIALRRVASRAAQTGRKVSAQKVKEIYTGVIDALPKYTRDPSIDAMYIYNNEGSTARLSWKRNIDGSICCVMDANNLGEMTIPCDQECVPS